VPLTFDQPRELERLGKNNVRERLRYAGASPGSVVPAVGDGKMLHQSGVVQKTHLAIIVDQAHSQLFELAARK
jgi:hypothetical protein